MLNKTSSRHNIGGNYWLVIEPSRASVNGSAPGRVLQAINHYINEGDAYLCARCVIHQRVEFLGAYSLRLEPDAPRPVASERGKVLSLVECIHDGLEAATDAGQNGLGVYAEEYRQTALKALEQLYKLGLPA